MEKALRKIRNGVYVITFYLDGKQYGITTAWVNRASFKPNTIMISIGKNREGYKELLESEVFCVNIMGDHHLEVARHFGRTDGSTLNDFKDVIFKESEATGSPVLKDSVGVLDCRLVNKIDSGDHAILVGEVVWGSEHEGDSMVFNREDFS